MLFRVSVFFLGESQSLNRIGDSDPCTAEQGLYEFISIDPTNRKWKFPQRAKLSFQQGGQLTYDEDPCDRLPDIICSRISRLISDLPWSSISDPL